MGQNGFTHLRATTTYSLRRSTIKTSELIKTSINQGVTSLALTDNNLAASVKHYKGCVESKQIKPILGCNILIRGDNNLFSHITLICRNIEGWRNLLKIIALSNKPENVQNQTNSIRLSDIGQFSNGIIAYSGGLSGFIHRLCSDNQRNFLVAKEYNEAKSFVSPNWKQNLDTSINELKSIFGQNFFLELCDIDNSTIPAAEIISKITLDASIRHKILCIGTCKPHYLKKEDLESLKILICSDRKASFRNINEVLEKEGDVEYNSFFRNNNAYLLNEEEYLQLYGPKILENNNYVASLCEQYDILSSPKIPQFDCPNNENPNNFLRKLCKDNWSKVPKSKEVEYQSRLDYELKVLEKVGLAPYFLIVHDIVQWANAKNALVCGRGSAGGTLTGFLLGIVESDPIKYNLYFERFYNEGRNTPGKISLADIDIDLPVGTRDECVEYLRNKYGRDKTANIATFGGLKGAGALKEVLRIKNVCSIEEMNKITKLIVDEHKISDELEELRKSGEDASVLGWTLDNVSAINEFASRNEDGSISGEYGPYFEQAIRLEGCKKTIGKHACGLSLASTVLSDSCPMVHDRTGPDLMCGIEMGDLEVLGIMKLDLLSLAALNDIQSTISLVNNGDFIRNN